MEFPLFIFIIILTVALRVCIDTIAEYRKENRHLKHTIMLYEVDKKMNAPDKDLGKCQY
jgi:hypothetical protein